MEKNNNQPDYSSEALKSSELSHEIHITQELLRSLETDPVNTLELRSIIEKLLEMAAINHKNVRIVDSGNDVIIALNINGAPVDLVVNNFQRVPVPLTKEELSALSKDELVEMALSGATPTKEQITFDGVQINGNDLYLTDNDYDGYEMEYDDKRNAILKSVTNNNANKATSEQSDLANQMADTDDVVKERQLAYIKAVKEIKTFVEHNDSMPIEIQLFDGDTPLETEPDRMIDANVKPQIDAMSKAIREKKVKAFHSKYAKEYKQVFGDSAEAWIPAWIHKSDRAGGSMKSISETAATEAGIDPEILFISIMKEDMSELYGPNYSAPFHYKMFGTWGASTGNISNLKKAGYVKNSVQGIPSGEKQNGVEPANFNSMLDGFRVAAGLIREFADEVDALPGAEKLTEREKDFWISARFVLSKANLKKMYTSDTYSKTASGDDAYLDIKRNKKQFWADVHNNARRRMQNIQAMRQLQVFETE